MSVKQIIVSNRQIWKDDTSKEPVKFYSIEEEPAADRKKLNAAAYNFELKKQGKI